MKKILIILLVIISVTGCTNDLINDYDCEPISGIVNVNNDIAGLYLLDNVLVEFNDGYCSFEGVRSDYSIVDRVINFSNYNFTIQGGILVINENSIEIGNSELLRIM